MRLRFLAIDLGAGGDQCPAVFVDEESGDLLFQGTTVSSTADLEQAEHSPFSELIEAATTSAVHLEMRDAYTPTDPVV